MHRWREPVTVTVNTTTGLYSIRLGRKYVAWELSFEAAKQLQQLIYCNPAYADEIIHMRATRVTLSKPYVE